MKTQDLLILAGLGAVVVWFMSRGQAAPRSPTVNVNTGRAPLANIPWRGSGTRSSTDFAGLISSGAGALKDIAGIVSPWFSKSTNSLSSAQTAEAVNVAASNRATWVDAPVQDNSFDVDYSMWA